MKKIIFLCSLLFVVGMIKCEENVAQKNKRSTYQDLLKLRELALRKQSSPILQELINLNDEVDQIISNLELELEACESANNCEESENLKILVKKLALKGLTLREKKAELDNSDESKEAIAILKKYQQ